MGRGVGRNQDPELAGAGFSGRYGRRSGGLGSTGVICRGQRQAEAEVPAAICRQIGRFWVGRRNCILPDIRGIRKSGLRGGGGCTAFQSCGVRRRCRPLSWGFQLITGAGDRGRWQSRRGRGFMGQSAHALVGVGSNGGAAISPEKVWGLRKSDSDFRWRPVIKWYAIAAPRLRVCRGQVRMGLSARKESETRALASRPDPRLRRRSARKFSEVGPTSGVAISAGTFRISRFRNSGDNARRAACFSAAPRYSARLTAGLSGVSARSGARKSWVRAGKLGSEYQGRSARKLADSGPPEY